MDAHHRLATYGTLAPGRPNHHQLAALPGTWAEGVVHGRLVDEGWGAGLGYPALVLDDDGPAVSVWVFTSADLPDHWDRLDAFEGDGYRRTPVVVTTADGAVEAAMYLHRPTR